MHEGTEKGWLKQELAQLCFLEKKMIKHVQYGRLIAQVLDIGQSSWLWWLDLDVYVRGNTEGIMAYLLYYWHMFSTLLLSEVDWAVKYIFNICIM